MKRPSQRPRLPTLNKSERSALAAGARYVGSGEHKIKGWWGGLPAAKQMPGGAVGRARKQTTTVCPLTTRADQKLATGWVRSAIAAGRYRFCEADKKYPHKIWHRVDGQVWFGRCINSEAGDYKGWPIEEEERRDIFD